MAEAEDSYSNSTNTGKGIFSHLLKLAKNHHGKCGVFINALKKNRKDIKCLADQKGRTPLMYLARYGCSKCMITLCQDFKDWTLNMNQRDCDKRTALMMASLNGNQECVKLLLKWSADVNKKDEQKNTALHYSVFAPLDRFSIDCVHLLLQHNCNVDAANNANITPLLQAVYSGNIEAVPLLIVYGAKPNIPDNHGSLPIVEAAYGGFLDVLKVLIENGVPINCRDSSGETALLVASREGHTDCVKFLLKNNADVSTVNESGQTSLMLTNDLEDDEIKDILHAAGCPPQRNPFSDTHNLKLWNMCCYVIRSQLLETNLHKNLLTLVPRLPVPWRIKRSLLENVSV